ncbi:MAG: hypothetical protein UW55_C0012G0023 [Candidatus Giovannonibacteria bacterium GW2011_GWA2_44_26]|uniref:Large polyvalent protein associated domain-containing protein n=1 Tax=Candidatus Giovannonibacteria bacterium GW2011_GWA2_44_26 TaxID=1618648 RepID=A0A0G1IU12_9BACT|nr:MAG: hypothetical protein UW55_C0012G0023 [Candidatus Giovannonibacteria bacterium GW2011_GWA2_44_26]
MAYIKDPKTGKYINTGSAPASPPLTVPKPSSAGTAVKYQKNAEGKFITAEVEKTAGKPNVTTVEGLRDFALQNNVDVSSTQPKESTLQKILHVLNTGGYAVGGLISGKGIKAGIKERIQPSEALGIKSKVGGFIADILLDPTTYLTFGYGAGAKLATKAGTVVLSKTGTSLLKKSILEVGEQGARKMLAEKVLAEGGEKFLAKGGLKFAGKQVLPRSAVTAPFKAADWLVEKTPVVGKIYESAKDLAGKAFVPFKSIKDLPGRIGEEYVDKFSQFTKATRSEVGKAADEAIKLGKTATKELGKDAGTRVGRMIEGMAEIPAKVSDGVEKTATAGNKIIDDIIGHIQGEHKRFATLEKERGLLDNELPDYLRHYLTPEGREFLQKNSDVAQELLQKTRVSTPFAKARTLDDTIVNINSYFRKTHGVKLFEQDAFKAFGARKAEHVKAVNTYDFLTDVGKQFGKQAEMVTKEYKHPISGQMVKKETAKPIFDNGMRYIESTVPQLKGVLLPEQIVKHVEETYKMLTSDEATKGFLKIYDKALGFWKGSVTGWFPAFHVRNSIGGIFNNFIAGVKNPTRYLQGDQIARGVKGTITTKLGTKYTYQQIKEIAEKLGVVGQPGYLDVMREVEKDIGKGAVGKLMDLPKNAMEITENRLRLPLFVDRLVKGDAPEEAAKSVFQFHFDYAPEGLAPFEQNIMKRLLPFYRWTRGNIPLQLEQMVKQPGKYAALGKFVDNLQVDKEKAKEEFQYLPPYMREGLPVRLGEKNGFSQYLYGLGLPVEDINRLYKGSPRRTLASMVGELSPILKYPIEAATGQNLFTGEPIKEGSRVYPFVNAVPGLRDWLEVSEHKNKSGDVSYRANAYKLHFLNTALGRFYTTAGKLSDDNTSGVVKFLYGLVGAKAKSVDMEKEKFWRDRDVQDRLEEKLEGRGLINRFDSVYVPK